MIRFPCNAVTCPCGRVTTSPRLGLCFPCYQRRRRGHTTAAACAICPQRDRRVLRRHKLAGGMHTLCANHAAIAGRRPLTLAELEAECFPAGDRRSTDRRAGDRRTTSPRRVRVVLERLMDGDRREGDRRARAEAPARVDGGRRRA
jgi:hypothetical protein